MTDDDVYRELADISRWLEGLPADAYGARLALRERQTELRAVARRAASDAVPTDELRAELARLRAEHERLVDRRLSSAHTGGGGTPGGGGIEPRHVQAVNAEIDRASGLADLEAAIQRLEVELANRQE